MWIVNVNLRKACGDVSRDVPRPSSDICTNIWFSAWISLARLSGCPENLGVSGSILLVGPLQAGELHALASQEIYGQPIILMDFMDNI